MITKQQALEFIYELSQKFIISMDLTNSSSYAYLNLYLPDYSFEPIVTEGKFNILEELVTKFIAKYINTNLFENIDIVPVDVDMLEVEQTYKVHIQQDWEHRYFTAKFIGFDQEDDYILKFENNKPISKYNVREIYKVNE